MNHNLLDWADSAALPAIDQTQAQVADLDAAQEGGGRGPRANRGRMPCKKPRVDLPPLPAALAGFTAALADELAAAYADQVVYPRRTVVEWPGPDSRFPGWPTPVLLLAVENQGVCAWGIPLDGDDDPPVLVGGELSDRTERTVRYAAGVDVYVSSRRWDRACLSDGLLVQAQAQVLDAASLVFLRARYGEVPSTLGGG